MTSARNKTLPEVPVTIWNSTFIGVFITNILMQFGQQMCNSLVPKYADYLNATPSVVGMVTSLFAVTAIVFKFISAPAIDTFNRKYILAGSTAIVGISYVGYSFSNSIPALMVFRLIQGIGMAFTATCCLALASDALPPDKLGSGIGYFSLAQAAGMAVAPTVALMLMNAIGYNLTFAIAAVCMLVSAVITTKLKVRFVRTRKFKISISSIVAREVYIPAIILLLLTTAYSVINSFLIIYGGKQGLGSEIGIYFTVNAVAMLISRPLVGRLTDKFGQVKILIPATIFFTASFVIISFSTTLWMFLLAAIASAFGYGASQPAIQALAMKMVPKERRGAASCTSYLGTDLGYLVGAPIAGTIAQSLGYPVMWRIMIFPILTAAAIILFFRKRISSAWSGATNLEDKVNETYIHV